MTFPSSGNGSGVASAAPDAAIAAMQRRRAERAFGDAAFRCAEKGWPVFPCRPGGKVPATPRGFKDATLDVGLVAGWWLQYPDANVAVATGAASGLVVLDVDGDEGFASLKTLGPLPDTLTVRTPRGGRHFYFAHPGGRVPCSAGKLGAGLDVRADGGYVLVPPSVVGGNRYRVKRRAPVAPLGGLLAPEPAVKQGAPADTWVAMVRDGLPAGERNAGLTRLVGHLLAKGVGPRLVAELAQLVNGRCRPPLASSEVDRIVVSIAGCELRKRAARG